MLSLKLFVGVISRLDRQADAPIVLVNFNQARGDFLANFEHVLDFINALLADLRDVDQPVNLMVQANEGAEAGQFGDLAGDQIADLVKMIDVGPRILRQLFNPDRNPLVRLIHFQHHRFHFVAFLQHFRWMVDFSRPGNIGNVNHAIEALFQFNERPVAGQVANLAFHARAGRVFLLRFVPGIGFELAQAQRNLLLFAIDPEHHRFHFLIGLKHVRRFSDAFGPG